MKKGLVKFSFSEEAKLRKQKKEAVAEKRASKATERRNKKASLVALLEKQKTVRTCDTCKGEFSSYKGHTHTWRSNTIMCL